MYFMSGFRCGIEGRTSARLAELGTAVCQLYFIFVVDRHCRHCQFLVGGGGGGEVELGVGKKGGLDD